MTVIQGSTYVIDVPRTLQPGGSPITVSGTAYSLDPSGSSVVLSGPNGVSTIPVASLPPGLVEASQTLQPGESPITVSGTVYSLDPSGKSVVVSGPNGVSTVPVANVPSGLIGASATSSRNGTATNSGFAQVTGNNASVLRHGFEDLLLGAVGMAVVLL